MNLVSHVAFLNIFVIKEGGSYWLRTGAVMVVRVVRVGLFNSATVTPEMMDKFAVGFLNFHVWPILTQFYYYIDF